MTSMIYLAPVDWPSIRQRPQQLALHLSQRYALKYVNAVGLRSVRPSDLGRVLTRVRGAQAEPAPFPVLDPRYAPLLGWSPLDEINRRWLCSQLRHELPERREPWILWIGAPSLLAETLLERSRPSLVVYDCMDHYAAFHGGRTRARIERAERAIVERADLVFATSRGLVERLRPFSSDVHLAPNGADVERFAIERTPAPPAWRRSLRGPVVGYHGTLGDWLDFSLLEWLADERADWSFVVIGPNQTRNSRNFLSRPNVQYLGPISYAELPKHTAWFDAGIIPFARNDLTRYVHPIKALEYLAAGLPTVAARLPDLADLSGFIQFASTPQQWLATLEDCLNSSQRSAAQVAARRRAAGRNTWQHVADSILAELEARLPSQPVTGAGTLQSVTA
ncbi:MAG TPA: glycosyltransferase [Pirellulales bacterium]|nr:glycosyltransferase [Pirellulales bacterium]